MQGNLNESAGNGKLSHSTKAPAPEQSKQYGGKQSDGKKPSSVKESRSRLQEATISVIAGGDNTAAEVLTNARAIADVELAPEKQEAAKEIADVLVNSERQQLRDIRDFFSTNRSDGTARLLAAVNDDILDGEVLP